MSKRMISVDKEVEFLKKHRQPIIENCTKPHICSRSNGNICEVYAFPSKKWRNGDCPMADEILQTKTLAQKQAEKIRVGQQKQKKKSRRKK